MKILTVRVICVIVGALTGYQLHKSSVAGQCLEDPHSGGFITDKELAFICYAYGCDMFFDNKDDQ